MKIKSPKLVQTNKVEPNVPWCGGSSGSQLAYRAEVAGPNGSRNRTL